MLTAVRVRPVCSLLCVVAILRSGCVACVIVIPPCAFAMRLVGRSQKSHLRGRVRIGREGRGTLSFQSEKSWLLKPSCSPSERSGLSRRSRLVCGRVLRSIELRGSYVAVS